MKRARQAMRRRGGGLAAELVLVIAALGCGRGAERAPSDAALNPPKDAIAKVAQNGPVKATVTVWPAKPTLSDTVYVRLTVDAEPDVAVELPFQTGQLGESALGRFRVVDFTRAERRTDAGHHVEEHTYALQALSSGRHRIPPFRLEMLDRRGGATGSGAGSGSAASAARPPTAAAAAPAEVLTEEVPLEIAPIPVEKVTETMQPALGPLSTSVGGRPWWWWTGLGGVVALWIGLAVALWRRWRAQRAIQRRRSAYDEAVAELRVLEQSGAPDVDSADAWFVRLSAIVRRYLESRYEIRAPELTSEEFLQVALRAPELTAEHRSLLASFLACCDRVKFAAYRPQAEESLDMLRAAKTFIEDTQLREGDELARKGGSRPGGRHAA